MYNRHNLICPGLRFESHIPENVVDQMNNFGREDGVDGLGPTLATPPFDALLKWTKMFYRSHRMDPVMIRRPDIDNGAFVLSPESVWYARALLLFSASALTDTGSKSFDCALVSTLETYNDPENGNYVYYTYYYNYFYYI